MIIKKSRFPNRKIYLMLTLTLIASLITMTLSLLATTPPATYAQTDEPDWGDIRGIRAIVALPTALSFRVRLLELTHEQVERVTLTIQQNEETIHQLDLDLDNSIFLDFVTEIEYEYNWVDLTDESLQLFQPLYYEFELETVEGLISNAGEEIELDHQGFGEWQMTGVDDVTLRYYDERLPAERHAETLNQVLALLAENIGFEDPIDFVIYPATAPLCIEQVNEATGQTESVVFSDGRPYPCSIDDLISLYANNGITFAVVDDTSFISTSNSLVWILVDTVYSERWGDADIPAWFKRGLEHFYSPNGLPNALDTVQRAGQQDRFLRLPEMATPLDETASIFDIELWDAQSYMLTLYLAENYGADAPFRIARAIDEDVSFLDVLDQVADASLDRIYSAWTLWVNTSRAEQVAVWNPYQDITPTPTATFTPSLIPPTRTPTLTLTISLTPTETLRFVPPTARITRLPPTLTPTASNTPLPPGFFDNPTPPPASTSTDDEGGGGLCGTGIGAILLPVAGLALAWRKRENG